uniref:Uncharacterized protein n=1 Tax=viral metagenome TaxID=1070528 RepID=A0A6C0JWB9_9ZZZZ
MDFSSPVKEPNGTVKITIQTQTPLKIEYVSTESNRHTTPSYDSPDFKKYLGEIAMMYESYSKKWFTRSIVPTIFLSKLMHKWDNGAHEPYRGNFKTINDSINVYQVWYPEQLLVSIQSFTIHWKLIEVLYKTPQRNSSSGPIEFASEEIPLDSTDNTILLQTTLRSRALHKVRQARLVSAVSKARADALTVRYYEKYGNLEELDSNSVLSSDGSE